MRWHRWQRVLATTSLVLVVASHPASAQPGPGPQSIPFAAASKAGAAKTDPRRLAPGFSALAAGDKLLVMPIDVELFSVSFGGVPEPRADWTAMALSHMTQAIRAREQQAKVDVVEVTPAQADEFAEQVGLHAAVAQSIALHQFGGPTWALPTKEGRLDWTFGDAMQPLATASGARYALFVWVRDTYATAERKALMLAFAAIGIGVYTGGVQVGYASLVDLHTGRVVWFNQLGRPYGDLREPAPARETVDALLDGFPGVQ